MSNKRDYYEVLGVERKAGDQEIKSAYRKLALQHHPDRNPDAKEAAEEKFKEITEAYSVLADGDKRAAYDRFGFAGVSSSAASSPDFSSSIFSDFEDIFGDFFGFGDMFGRGRGQGTRARRSADLRYDLEISFEEAASGIDTKIKIPRSETCITCNGNGARKGSAPVTCPACGGRGQIRHQQGFFTISRGCPQCGGHGQVFRDSCSDCHGEGRVRREKVLSIRIPTGVDEGTRLRVAGEGESGAFGGPSGDLYVVLRVRDHAFFDRRGNDLYCTIPISIAQAALGAELKVPTLNGLERLRIPEGTQSGSVVRLHGKGLASLEGRGHGDLYVILQVVTPTHLNREQRRFMEMLAPGIRVENKPLERRVPGRVKDNIG